MTDQHSDDDGLRTGGELNAAPGDAETSAVNEADSLVEELRETREELHDTREQLDALRDDLRGLQEDVASGPEVAEEPPGAPHDEDEHGLETGPAS